MTPLAWVEIRKSAELPLHALKKEALEQVLQGW